MKKSSEYPVGASVLVDDLVLTKKSDEVDVPNSAISYCELWADQNGKEYCPSLLFQLGQSEPEFHRFA